METKSVMIVGVGGQGSLLASRILGMGDVLTLVEKAEAVMSKISRLNLKA